MEIQHKGWDWEIVKSSSWNEISGEFLPVALDWKNKFHSILDIGAGKGRHALFFAKNGFETSAIDLSESSITYINEIAQKENLNVNAVTADMTALPFEENKFDCVICFHTIYHTDYKGLRKTLQEIKRVLKPSGEVYITFNSKKNPHFEESLSPDGYTIIRTDGHEQGIPHCYVNTKDLFDILKDFEIVSMNESTDYIRKSRQSQGIHYFVHLKNNK